VRSGPTRTRVVLASADVNGAGRTYWKVKMTRHVQ